MNQVCDIFLNQNSVELEEILGEIWDLESEIWDFPELGVSIYIQSARFSKFWKFRGPDYHQIYYTKVIILIAEAEKFQNLKNSYFLKILKFLGSDN